MNKYDNNIQWNINMNYLNWVMSYFLTPPVCKNLFFHYYMSTTPHLDSIYTLFTYSFDYNKFHGCSKHMSEHTKVIWYQLINGLWIQTPNFKAEDKYEIEYEIVNLTFIFPESRFESALALFLYPWW